MKKSEYEHWAKMYCKIYDLPMPIFEFKFMKNRKFRVDMAYPARDLMIEIEGGIWSYGRHNRGDGFLKDMQKYNLMSHKRLFLLRYTPQEIKKGTAFADIKRWFDGESRVKATYVLPWRIVEINKE